LFGNFHKLKSALEVHSRRGRRLGRGIKNVQRSLHSFVPETRNKIALLEGSVETRHRRGRGRVGDSEPRKTQQAILFEELLPL